MSVGLPPPGGLPMATCSGEIEPGGVLEWVELHGPEQATDMLYRKCVYSHCHIVQVEISTACS